MSHAHPRLEFPPFHIFFWTMAQEQFPSDQSHHQSNDGAEKSPARPKSRPPPPLAPWVTPGSALLFASIPLGLGGYIGYRRALHEAQSQSQSASASASTSASSSSSSSTSSSKSAPSASLSKGSIHGGGGVGSGVGNGGGKGTNSILGRIIHHPEPPISSSSPQSTPPKNLPSNTSIISSSSRSVISTTPPPVIAARALALGSLLSITGTSLLLSSVFFASGCTSLDELISTWKSWAPRKLHQMENSLERTFGISAGRERRSSVEEYERATEGMTEEEELDYVAEKYGGEF